MKKGLLTCLSLIVIFPLLTVTGRAQSIFDRISFRLSGGYGSFLGGDMTDFADGINSQIADKAALFGGEAEGEIKNAKWGGEFEGEIIFNLSDRFGIGLSVGTCNKKSNTSASLALGSLAGASIQWKPAYSTVPVKLSGYYFLPISARTKFFFKAGIGYYPSHIDFSMRQDQEILGVAVWSEDEGEADGSAIGYTAGLGLEYGLTENVSFFVEGMGRYVSINNWEARNINTNPGGTLEENGCLWFIEMLDVTTGIYYPGMLMQDQLPVSNIYRNIHKAEIDFSGFFFGIGMRVKF